MSKKKLAKEVLYSLIGSLIESMNDSRLLTEPELHGITSVLEVCRKHLSKQELVALSVKVSLMIDTDQIREPDENSSEPYLDTFKYFVRVLLGQK